MRERITFVHHPSDGFDPKALNAQHQGLTGPDIEATREDRLTFTLDELPTEISEVLGDYQEVHLRWTSQHVYEALEPFASRLSPGLHLSHLLQQDPTKLFSILGLDRASPEATTTLKDAYSTRPDASHYFEEMKSPRAFKHLFNSDICLNQDSTCEQRLQSLLTATSLELFYDADAQTVKFTAFWPHKEQTIDFTTSPVRRTEIGFIKRDTVPNTDTHDLGVSGVLVVLGEQKDPSATVFAFPSRHRNSDVSFSSTFLEPTGLHPTLQLSLSSNLPPVADADCSPYAYFTLPNVIFADRYQLEDGLFIESKNLTALRDMTLSVDLEAPAYTTKPWGSNLLLQLAPPTSVMSQAWTAELPLHLRYLGPSETGERQAEVPYPVVFWACPAESGTDFKNSPFDRRNLGYDNLFSPETVFWHVEPNPADGDRLVSSVTVPVLKDEGSDFIGYGTTAVIALGFAWITWKLVSSFTKTGYGNRKTQSHDKSKKET